MKKSHFNGALPLPIGWSRQLEQQNMEEAIPAVTAAVGTPPPPPPPAADPRIARLEADLEEQRRMVQNLRPPPNQQPSPDIQALNRQFYASPVAASQAIANQAVQEALRQHGAGYMETLIETAKQQARSSDAPTQAIFDKYYSEIEARVKLTDPQFHANSTVWKSAFDMVRGAHISDILAAAQATPPPTPTGGAPAIHISPSGGPGAPNPRAAQAPPGVTLTAEQSEMAKNLGLTKEQYAKGIDLYANQAPRGKSSFDDVITFSSQDKRRAERAKRRAAAAK